MNKWEELKKEISSWRKDAQTEEEYMVLKIVTIKMIELEEKEKKEEEDERNR